VVLQERDDEGHTVTLKADGREQRGKGAASALVRSRLEAVDGGTKVYIDTDLTISGAVAQYGRGMVADISQRLTKEFAQCLQANITAEEPVTQPPPETSVVSTDASPAASPAPAPASPPSVARPVQGLRLGLWAVWRVVVRFLKRLFGRRGG
jgi:hypothetical protein